MWTNKPKVVIAPEGCNEYLTVGKKYGVIGFWDNHSDKYGYCFTVLNNNGDKTNCLEKGCGHLNGGDWIIKERTMKTNIILPIIAIITGIALCLLLKFGLDALKPTKPTKTEKMQIPYHVQIINEREVLLWSDKGDSLKLLFEDAFNLMEERVVFIEE